MLKKILPIFCILCLVFSLTVPCFSLPDDEDFVNPDSAFYSDRVILWCLYNNSTIKINGNVYNWGQIRYFSTTDITVQRGGNYPVDNVYIYVNGNRIYSGSIVDPYTFTVDFGDSIFISIYPVSVYRICNYSSTTINFYWYWNSDPSLRRVFQIPSNRFVYFGFIDSQPCYIDQRNLFFNETYYSSSDPFAVPHSNLNIYDPDHVGDQTIDLYKNLFHSFDYFPDLVNQYRPVFIYITAIISILIFIFVVVFMIKRFTGGKT